jgi:hypothetical protein
MKLSDVVSGIQDLHSWSHAEKIKFFGWYIHTYRSRDRFSPTDIRQCYDELSLEKPSNVNPYLQQLEKQKPKSVLRDSRGYYLAKQIKDSFDTKYGKRLTAIQVDKLLESLPSKIPSLAERTYLDEALICFRNSAFRASIVMCWNLALDHLCEFILQKYLPQFNTQLPITYPKTKAKSVAKKDDFDEIKEYEILQVCKSANIISGDVYKIMAEKLGKRNSAAHPANVVITQLQAEDFISDLVNNVVLKLV